MPPVLPKVTELVIRKRVQPSFPQGQTSRLSFPPTLFDYHEEFKKMKMRIID